MTRTAKLYSRAIANPRGLSFREFERLLKIFGFVHARTTGSHRHYVHKAVTDVLTIVADGKAAKGYQVRQLLELIDQFGLSIEE